MNLPNVYVVFEQKGNGPIIMRNATTDEKEAERMRRYHDTEPKSGRIFVEVYVSHKR